jgi:hypothetical protein
MISFNPWTGPQFKSDPKVKGRVQLKLEKKAADEKAWRECCAVVDARDKGRCRYCGKRGKPESTSLLDRIHRHHLEKRSKGGEHLPGNVVSVCAACHELAERHRLDIRGDANGPLDFFLMAPDGRYYLAKREQAPGVFSSDPD